MPNLYPQMKQETLLDIAADYLRRGWQPLPIPQFDKNDPKKDGKNPNFPGWQNLKSDESDLSKYFNGKPQNIGVLLGNNSNGLTDIDIDSPEAVKLADHFLPKTDAVFGRIGKPRSHRLYVSDFPKTEKFEFGETIVEIRSSGGQTVFPPSIHESGEKIEWFEKGEPLDIKADALRRAVALLASACIISKFWKQGIRHDLSLAVSGAMLRNGYDARETGNFIKAICSLTNDEETQDRLQSVKTTAEKIKTGEKFFGLPKLAELTDTKLADAFSKWLGITSASAYIGGGTNTTVNNAQSNFSANPKPLDSVLKPVEEIDTDYLPEILTRWLKPASMVIGCPFDFLVLSAIVNAGSLIGSRVRLKPLQHSDWFVVPNLYAGLVGFPSTKKTPALDETRKPILELQDKARNKYEIVISDYEIEEKFYKKQADDIFKKFKGNNVQNLKTQLAGLDKPEEPKLRRFETNDVTASKLIQLLSDNPNGFLLFRDELTGWLKSLDAEYDKSARPFFLELWKGGISYELARVDGREIQLKSGTLSIVGGIQPSKLQRYVSEAYSFDNSDGFLQRFLFAYPDVTKKTVKPTQSDYQAMQAGFSNANKAFQKLADFDFRGKVITHNGDIFCGLKFNPDAQAIADDWREQIEDEAESIQVEDEPFSSFLYKISKNCFAITLIFHCLENIESSNVPGEISETTILRAINYTDVLISHAKRVFGLGENQVFSLANSLLGKIKKGNLEQGFTQYDLKRKQWSGLKDYNDIRDVLDLLLDYGYLSEVTKTKGRKTIGYNFHPSLESN